MRSKYGKKIGNGVFSDLRFQLILCGSYAGETENDATVNDE